MGRLKNLPIFKKRAAFVQLSGGHRPCRHGLMPLLFYLVGTSRLELLTPSVSRKCSSHLSYAPTPRGEVLSSENHPLSQQLFLNFFSFLFSEGCGSIFCPSFCPFFAGVAQNAQRGLNVRNKKSAFFSKKMRFFLSGSERRSRYSPCSARQAAKRSRARAE